MRCTAAATIRSLLRRSCSGEPSGTAGRPIAGAIEGEGLDYACVLVTRSGHCQLVLALSCWLALTLRPAAGGSEASSWAQVA